MNDRFAFLKSYADTLTELEKADKDLARELAWKIIQYGIYNNDENSWNPIIEAMFVQIKIMIDKGQDITEKRRNANQKRTNINKWWTKDEQKWTNEEQTEPKKKKEKRKDKKENNTLSISEDKSSQEDYWNREVNRCLTLIKQYNNWILNGAEWLQRKYAWNLIRKLKKLNSVENGKYKWEEVLDSILMIISKDEYHRTKIASPQLIFDNLATLMQRCAVIGEKQNVWWWEVLQVI